MIRGRILQLLLVANVVALDAFLSPYIPSDAVTRTLIDSSAFVNAVANTRPSPQKIQKSTIPTASFRKSAVILTRAAVNGDNDAHSFTTNNSINGNLHGSNRKAQKLPFIIEALKPETSDQIYQEISRVCIQAFFNDNKIQYSASSSSDDSRHETSSSSNNSKYNNNSSSNMKDKLQNFLKFNSINNGNSKTSNENVNYNNLIKFANKINNNNNNNNTPLWKEWQLGYLRNLQQSDLKIRRRRNPESNAMFVARRVYPLSEQPDSYLTAPLIMDVSEIFNFDEIKSSEEEYVRGEILGFVEVTQRPYGLGEEKVGFDMESKIKLRKCDFYDKRPVLTNLSVKAEARQSGVGSKLVQACERVALEQWGMKEIILEVEDDNLNALRFYEKRGYKVLFEDPASRRYDTNGMWLRQVRCKRKIMRKVLRFPETIADNTVGSFSISNIWQKIRENVFANV